MDFLKGAENLMADKLIGLGHLKLRNAVRDIQDKHKDIIKLERVNKFRCSRY